jgi:uridine kinase
MRCARGPGSLVTMPAGPRDPHRLRTPGRRPVSRARADLLAAVADRVPTGRRVRVGVDGRGGAGKTVFAGELAAVLTQGGRGVLRASVDGFHRPRADRYRRGGDSPVGYWLDAYDYDRMTAALLDPFGRGEPARTAVHDVRTDATLDLPPVPVGSDDVLIVDGVFVHRDELAPCWDFSVYLHVDLAVSLVRMSVRDHLPVETTRRYTGAHRLYLDACDPLRRASVVVDNTDLGAPRMIKPAG